MRTAGSSGTVQGREIFVGGRVADGPIRQRAALRKLFRILCRCDSMNTVNRNWPRINQIHKMCPGTRHGLRIWLVCLYAGTLTACSATNSTRHSSLPFSIWIAKVAAEIVSSLKAASGKGFQGGSRANPDLPMAKDSQRARIFCAPTGKFLLGIRIERYRTDGKRAPQALP